MEEVKFIDEIDWANVTIASICQGTFGVQSLPYILLSDKDRQRFRNHYSIILGRKFDIMNIYNRYTTACFITIYEYSSQ